MWSRRIAAYPFFAVLAVACGSELPSDYTATGGTPGGTTAGTAGSLSTGGSAAGGKGSGGAALAGAATGGNAAGGAATTGGTSTGGQPAGGAGVGGANTGGKATGGTSTGGSNTGGKATGGVSTGGQPTGGAGVGGSNTGGKATGGASTGGQPTGGAGTGGKATGGTGGTAPSCTCVNSGPPVCTATGKVTYTLARSSSPTAQEQSAYDAITCAMNMATAYYNCYTNITKSLNVSYAPSVATADGNINGSIRFGSTTYMNCITAMHEIGHTVGIGTAGNWGSQVSGGNFTGANATQQLRSITGNQADVVHADTQHFWPYGLNYTSEVSSTTDLVDHCLMVVAIRKDLGM
jgi:hypothetical protein